MRVEGESLWPREGDRFAWGLQWLLVVAVAGMAIDYGVRSIHWPLMLDSPIMHYVVFLMHHGLKPYSEITDNNMPGAYLTEAWAMAVFGGSDLAWRVYEFFLLAVMAVSLVVMARRREWVAGVFAAGVFLAYHAAEGPRQMVEREEIIAVLLVVGYACLFTAVRSRRAWMAGVFGFAGGMAVSIKPTFGPLLLLLLVMAAVELRRRGVRWWSYAAWGVGGMAVAGGLDLWFLVSHDAVGAFVYITRIVTPAYHNLGHGSLWPVAERSVPKYMLLMLPFAAWAGVLNWRQGLRWDWERWAVLIGVGCGLLSYFVQGKGLVYHRYVYLICLLLLAGLEVVAALRGKGAARWAGAAAVLVTVLVVFPLYARGLHRVAGDSVLTLTLEDDLRGMGGAGGLQRKVQCFDMTEGCLNALYHLGLVENTGFTGDMLLYSRQIEGPPNEAMVYYRNLFWKLQQKDPAEVLVMSNQYLGAQGGYAKVDDWPEFKKYLGENYAMRLTRSFPMEGLTDAREAPKPEESAGYRIYVRKTEGR